MGLFDFLFGKPKPAISLDGISFNDDDVDFDSHLMTITSLGFVGPYKTSTSGNFVLGWQSITGDERQNGEVAVGQYALFYVPERKLVVKGQLEHPGNGIVNNHGIFSLEAKSAGGLSGEFYVFARTGEIIFSHGFNANIVNSGLSENGKLAVCQTANNPDDEDGNLLTLFDVFNKKILFSVHPESGWADDYQFDERSNMLIQVFRNGSTYRYDENGKFLDLEKYMNDQLDSDRYDIILSRIQDMVKNENPCVEDLKRALYAIKRTKDLGALSHQSWNAVVYKLEGIVYERLGEKKKAISAYKNALELNPKIGVKRRMESLLKS